MKYAVLATIGASLLLIGAAPIGAQLEQPAIKALSSDQQRGLLAGAGLGYAKTAEGNGWPGPLHVLELRDTLALTETQVSKMAALLRAMKAQAIPLGQLMIEAEQELDALFRSGDPSAQDVAVATARIAKIAGQLRAVHLTTHLRTAPLLSRHQTMLYAQARGHSDPQGSGGHVQRP